MRIAISGTHTTGKSTLVAALADYWPGHEIVPEPYEILEERGYEFAHPPTLDDYVVQLRQSLLSLRRRSPNLIFERCPLDLVAYILASPDADRFDLDAWREPISRAMARLDLVVTLHPDPAHEPGLPLEEAMFRRAVDDTLRDLIADDDFDLDGHVAVLPLDGPWENRLERVLGSLSSS
ncbi:MAG: AAA family ATPase [Thermomicrobiales bacterium]|nr:AAA family ATPase [Thermomicrobiales bacterium]